MKKEVKSLTFLLFCLFVFPVGLLAQDKTNVEFNESGSLQVEDISVQFKPEKFVRSKIYQNPEYLDGHFFLNLVNKDLSISLPMTRKPDSHYMICM